MSKTTHDQFERRISILRTLCISGPFFSNSIFLGILYFTSVVKIKGLCILQHWVLLAYLFNYYHNNFRIGQGVSNDVNRFGVIASKT
ncbi:hypothetical protein NMY3_00545 [Candidatus Nitrosocosmicus oleophilus]|uniref:Uncharacterized protein n=1 Tax=Candidatus Nitrosocosmicus oleophilus TaxID=1353260 RepID=A0A654LUV7_9ARCH|nr:hypothetical protein NMY3_00545 [Candidatus Nitrosocosmicus oleophilus]